MEPSLATTIYARRWETTKRVFFLVALVLMVGGGFAYECWDGSVSAMGDVI